MSAVPTPHTKWPVAVAFGLVGSLLVALVVLAFLWPAKAAKPANLPISLTGPDASVSAFEQAIGKASPGTFDFVAADDRGDAVTQIKTRETYGAIVLAQAPQPPEVLTAPAGSPVAAQLLTGLATQLQAQLSQQVAAAGGDASTVKVTVTAIVPFSETDPTGTGLAAASFPLTLGGMTGGVLISLLVVGPRRRLAALIGFGTACGVILALILQAWFKFLPGEFWPNALAIGFSILATSTFIVGCASLLGQAGTGLGAVLTLLVGNPLSAAAIPWQFLPTPWGAIGQLLVPGAANWLIRSINYFPDADNSKQLWVLAGWTAAGVILTLIGHYRDRSAMRIPQGTLEDESPAPLTA